jgi:hypothetical protein
MRSGSSAWRCSSAARRSRRRYIAPYDLALAACAVVLIVTCSLASGFLAGEAIVMALAWIVPIVRPVDALPGRSAPLVIAAAGAYAVAHCQFGTDALQRKLE